MDTTTKSTVSNTASSSEPLLKRKRIEQSGNSDSGVGSSGATSSSPIRDEKYYMDSEGADCVVLADNVLFKVRSRFDWLCSAVGLIAYRSTALFCQKTGLPLPICSLCQAELEMTVISCPEKAPAMTIL